MQNRILGIDPGFDRMGVAVLDGNQLLFSKCIETNRKLPHSERLAQIGKEVRAVIKEWEPAALAIEELFFNKSVGNALKVSEARGVAIYEAALAGLATFEYSPQAIKIAVTGYGKADKAAVDTLVRKLVKLPSKKVLDDEIDAVAVCITHLATRRAI